MADPPFDDLTANFILRSCDDVDFRVDKGFLARTSPLLEGLLGMPHTHDDAVEDDVPVMTVTENRSQLDTLLRFMLPGADPPLHSLSAIVSMLEMARKYELVEIKKRVVKALRAWILACEVAKSTFGDLDSIMDMVLEYELLDIRGQVQDALMAAANLRIRPLRVFLLAYRYMLEKVAKCAAWHTLSIPLTGLEPVYSAADLRIEGFEELPCAGLLRLLKYHGDCRNVALGCVSHPTHPIPPEWRNARWYKSDDCHNNKCSRNWINVELDYVGSSLYWQIFLGKVQSALRCHPCGDSLRSNFQGPIKEAILSCCDDCRGIARRAFTKYLEYLATQVDEAVANVKFIF